MKNLTVLVLFAVALLFIALTVHADEGPWRQNHFEIGVRGITTTNLGLEEKVSPEIYLSKQLGVGLKSTSVSAAVIVSLSERETPKVETNGEGNRSAGTAEVKFFFPHGFSFNLGAQLSQTRTPDWTKDALVPFTRIGYTFGNGLYLIELRATAPDNTENEAQSMGLSFFGAIPTKESRFTYIWGVGYSIVTYHSSLSDEKNGGSSLQIGLGVRF